jgi:L-ribulose-5-phosphate 4-epimerase
VFAIKPSGVAYETLRPEDMVVVDLANRVVEGRLRPSSDTPTHAVMYQALQGIGGICHSHSPHAVAWAQACREIPVMGTTQADHLTTAVPVTEVMSDEAIRGNYEEQTGQQILQRLRGLDHHETEMVLVACHGPFTWGSSALKAVFNSKVLEELARIAWVTLSINPATPPLKQSLIDKHYQRKHGAAAYYGQ